MVLVNGYLCSDAHQRPQLVLGRSELPESSFRLLRGRPPRRRGQAGDEARAVRLPRRPPTGPPPCRRTVRSRATCTSCTDGSTASFFLFLVQLSEMALALWDGLR
ncbi:hypothetical protein F4775DRAFT_597713 [Biscogniauxia sp. FL1348]|nr:hypothetical protein F4775DRAFT_597713 [Biscogniauxia sp. FL1348]